VQTVKQVITRLQAIEICPVTNGLPTTMTQRGFKAACQAQRLQSKTAYGEQRAYKYTFCNVCKGKKLPQELRIATLKELVGPAEKRQPGRERSGNVGASPDRKKGAVHA
jgi:hypothetical protein